ncbi:MAG: hypothetical protein K0S29_1365, partial [Gammaproteobacteria bacterium]|nr:hypothetical protein [Gammaproteobacteria bacterium]
CFTSSDSLQVFPSANANFYGSGALQLYSVLEPISNNTECQLNFPKQFIQPLSVNGSRNRFELASDEFLANFAKEISLNCSGNPAKIQFSAQAQNSKLETSSMLSSTVQFAKNCTSFFKASAKIRLYR